MCRFKYEACLTAVAVSVKEVTIVHCYVEETCSVISSTMQDAFSYWKSDGVSTHGKLQGSKASRVS